MPHYDETFIHDDNQNQRRNKRSYRVYKHGLRPLGFFDNRDVIQTIEEHGSSVIKRNIKNIKQINNRPKNDATVPNHYYIKKYRNPDIIVHPLVSTFDPNRLYYDIRNNNIIPLSPCKSYDNLNYTNKAKRNPHMKEKLKCGMSLQNLSGENIFKHFSSPAEDKTTNDVNKGETKNSYSVVDALKKQTQRRFSRTTAAPGIGVYRKISGDSTPKKPELNNEGCDGSSGHRGSLRGANKLARRARSFKDDLLERISNMRSPGQQHHPPHVSSALRSHSPLSPKLRSTGAKLAAAEEAEVTPAKELERLVKEVTFGLKHFSDVITKRKLEMLPDNGTIVFESIANIHKAIKPYCARSPPLTSAVKRLCAALAMLIRLCDEITALSFRADASNTELDSDSAALSAQRVSSVVVGVTAAAEEAATIALRHMTSRPALAPRPALVSPRPPAQRSSLPDIPLTPKERSLLTGESGNDSTGVRASHSSESILDAPETPPPKPARPSIRKMELAPPLPPKRKSANDNSLLGLSIDRLSLQSHSSGSLDSILNVSNDEDRHGSDVNNHDNLYTVAHNSDLASICSCNNSTDTRSSMESHELQSNNIFLQNNHNRLSNESGFISEISTEHSFTSAFSQQHYSSHSDSNFDTTDCVSELKCRQSSETRMNVINLNSSSSLQYSLNSKLASITSDDSETPPELPAKTRRNIRADVQQHFPNVEIRQTAVCSLHGETRPHTLADHHPPRPPPLPLKKRHIMAYMEMFVNCNHTGENAVAAPDMIRHSIHTSYNLESAQHRNAGGLSIQRNHQVQRSIAQSFTVQHFGTTPLSGSDDSMSITSSGTSPIPPEPPALPPKMSKSRQLQLNSSNELLPPLSPRPSSHNSSTDETLLNNSSDDSFVNSLTPGKFPLDDEIEILVQPPASSPLPTERNENSLEPPTSDSEVNNSPVPPDSDDIMLQTDISSHLSIQTDDKDGPEVKGGHPEALIVLATKATKDFAYQEAFLATYRTWVSPSGLVARLIRRAQHFKPRPHELRSTLSLLTRVVADLTMTDLDGILMQEIMEFIYWLVDAEELAIAKALRQILVDKQKQLHFQQNHHRYEYDTPCYGSVSLRRDTLLDFKATEIAEQMTLLDAALFVRLTTAEVLSWPRDQSEDKSPNLTRFTEHFNKMSYWARTRILEQDDAQKREKYAIKFLKVMKVLRKINNFNSYLALVAALDCPPVERLGWSRAIVEALHDHCAILDSSSSHRAYRRALAETQPPCIPYIGLILQDLTFVSVGNPDLLPDGSINFTKRWQQYHIMENIKRFHKDRQYKFKKNDRIQAMFNGFDDFMAEDALWTVSESIKPRVGKAKPAAALAAPVAAAQSAA